MSDKTTEPRCECGRTDICGLCLLLSMPGGVTGFQATPEQEAAMEAYMAAEGRDTTGPAYQRMVAAGLPQWGEDIRL